MAGEHPRIERGLELRPVGGSAAFEGVDPLLQCTVLAAHLAEAALYALAYYAMQTHLAIGSLVGHLEGDFLDFLYFSLATYTTLGIGDVQPSGAMRIVAGIESLNGLVLIGWSASFTYLTMEKVWDIKREAMRQPGRKREEPAHRIGVVLSVGQSVRSVYAAVKRQCAFLSNSPMTIALITFAVMLSASVGILLALVGLEMRPDSERRAPRRVTRRRRPGGTGTAGVRARARI